MWFNASTATIYRHGLSACTAAATPSPAPTAEADTIAPFPESGDIDPGTYLVTGYPVPFEITVPDGWESFDGGAGLSEEGEVYLTFWPTPYVPTDACAWQGALVQIDPTAEAFVDAMTAQTSTVSTPPIKVMAGDYSGFEFDLSMEGDVDRATATAASYASTRIRRRTATDAGTQLWATAKPTEWST